MFSRNLARSVCALFVPLTTTLVVLVGTASTVSAALPSISCTSDPNLFNTGYDAATGGILPNNSVDANWTVGGPTNSGTTTTPITQTSTPPGGLTFTPANVGAIAGAAYSPSPYGNAQWISQQTIASPTSPEGDWYYEYQFNLSAAVAVSTFQLNMNYMADNEVATVFVNGVDQSTYAGSNLPQDPSPSTTSPYQYQGYKYANAAQTVLSHDWVTGLNTIIVQVKSGPPEQAFDAQWRPSAICPVALAATTTSSPNPYVPGQVLTFTDTVTNSGPANAYGVSVSDPLPAALASAGFTWTCSATIGSSCTASGSGSVNDPSTIVAEAGTLTYTITGTVPAGTTGTLSNTVTVTPGAGTTDSGCTPNCSATNTDSLQAPAVTETTSSTTASYAAVGDTIAYQFLVRNSGNATLHGIAVNGTMSAPATQSNLSAISCPSTTLAPAASETCTATYTVTQADLDNGLVQTSAVASGLPPGSTSAVTSPASGTTVVGTQTPAVTETTSSTTSSYSAVGNSIAYQFLVSNSGNVTLHGIAVNDTMSAPATQSNLSAISCPSTTLAPSASETCTATYTVTQADLDNGSVQTSAVASGLPPGSTSAVTSPASGTTVVGTQTPAVTETTSSTTSSYSAVGNSIAYQFLVRNSGNVTLHGIAVNDTMSAPAMQSNLSAMSCPSTTLAPAASERCTATYTVTQADLDNGSVHISAVASALPPGSTSAVTSPASGTTVTAPQAPALTETTSSTTTSYSAAGNTVVYHFVVSNSGNVTLHGIAVTDTMSAPSTQSNLSAMSCPSTTLAPLASETCTATYTVTQTDVDNGSVHISAVASALPLGSTSAVTSPASGTTVMAKQSPALIVVTSSPTVGFSSPGNKIIYDFLVRNSGNVTLSGIKLHVAVRPPGTQANLSSLVCTVTRLAPGAQETCTATYTVTRADVAEGTVRTAVTASAMSSGTMAVVTRSASVMAIAATVPVPQTGVALLAHPWGLVAAIVFLMFGFGFVVAAQRRHRRLNW